VRQDDDDVARSIGQLREKTVGRRPASEHRLVLSGANHIVGNQVGADRCRVELNATVETVKFAAPVRDCLACGR
jgi:hypothetical protein